MAEPLTRADASQLPNPAPLMRLALAYRSSMALFAATDLDVFTPLAEGPLTAAAIAERRGALTEPMRLLLDACVAEGLLTRDGDRYANTPIVEAYLVQGRPAYIAHGLKFAEDLYPAWGRLTEMVRTGRPTLGHDTMLGEDKEKTRAFVYAMHERAKGLSAVLPHGADFSGRTRLLDVGGGPATYSMALIQKTPGLTSTVLDLPGVLRVGQRDLEAIVGPQLGKALGPLDEPGPVHADALLQPEPVHDQQDARGRPDARRDQVAEFLDRRRLQRTDHPVHRADVRAGARDVRMLEEHVAVHALEFFEYPQSALHDHPQFQPYASRQAPCQRGAG